MYTEDELLMLSGIQHFYYCQRQWALIHIEQQWDENVHTIKGDILHEKVDDPYIQESRNDRFISRSMPLVSYELGFYGISDAVEFILDNEGVYIPRKSNFYRIVPIEYKVGKPKEDNCDAIQLCVQAMCLEEMFQTKIQEGYLYYGKTRHRNKILINEKLRNEAINLSLIMHRWIQEDKKISPIFSAKCSHCSLYHLCLPRIKQEYGSVSSYIKSMINEGGDNC